MKFFETSAKEGSGIQEAMEEIVRQAAQQKKEEEEEIFIPREINLGEEGNVPNRMGSHGDCGC
jgi:type I restriction-modification system DNA methylase subunit